MGYMMIEVSESKLGKMSEYAEDALHAMGRLMSCLSSLEGGYGERSEGGGRSMMGNRGGYGNRYDEMDMRGGGYGSRMNYRDEEEEEMWGERRGVRGTGRGRR